MKTLGYIFAIMGAIAFVVILFGYTQHFLSLTVCGLMAYAILSEDDVEDDDKAGSRK